jgi:hypothetical protein
MGRYISQDTIGFGGGVNLYVYAKNPVSFVDPLGLQTDPTWGYSEGHFMGMNNANIAYNSTPPGRDCIAEFFEGAFSYFRGIFRAGYQVARHTDSNNDVARRTKLERSAFAELLKKSLTCNEMRNKIFDFAIKHIMENKCKFVGRIVSGMAIRRIGGPYTFAVSSVSSMTGDTMTGLEKGGDAIENAIKNILTGD